MCTVTYFPKPSGFILTHNRDEAPSRSPQSIVKAPNSQGDSQLFPRDTQAGGTWIVTASQGRTACLLNGAFSLHTRQPPYRRSRGLILLDFFDWDSPDAFFQDYDFEGIEPFTFLYFEKKEGPENVRRIAEFRWDGQKRYLKDLPPDQAHFWCSATLYPPEMQIRRAQVFKDWLMHQTPFSNGQATNRPIHQSLITLHQSGSVGDPENDYVMNRGGKVQTVSITQVLVDEKNARMRYFDILGGNQSERRLSYSQRRLKDVNR